MKTVTSIISISMMCLSLGASANNTNAFKIREAKNKLERLEIRAVKAGISKNKIESDWNKAVAKLKDLGVVVDYNYQSVTK